MRKGKWNGQPDDSSLTNRRNIRRLGAIASLTDRGQVWLTVIGVGGQHLVGLAGFSLFPLLVARAAHLPPNQLAAVPSTAFLTIAVANLLQASRFGAVGTGYLVPSGYAAVYLAPSLVAVRLGGLPLVAGMTVAAGICERAFSRAFSKLRFIFPPDILCIVLILVGISNGLTGFRHLAVGAGRADLMDAVIAFGTMVLLALFKRTALYAVLLGVGAGYAAATWQGTLSVPGIANLPIIGLPRIAGLNLSFEPGLLPSFAAVALVAVVKQTAFVEGAQKLSCGFADVQTVKRGVLADGIGTAMAGLFGSIGVNASASSQGLNTATGVSDRRISWVLVVAMMALCLVPPVGAIAAAVPKGALAAFLVFTSVFVATSGIKGLGADLDQDRSIVVGCGLLAGLAVEAIPRLANFGPGWAAPVLGSSIGIGTMVAMAVALITGAKGAFLTRIRFHTRS